MKGTNVDNDLGCVGNGLTLNRGIGVHRDRSLKYTRIIKDILGVAHILVSIISTSIQNMSVSACPEFEFIEQR